MTITSKEADRLHTTLSALPDATASVLEIGFADGRMSSALRARVPRCVSLDLPRVIRDGTRAGRVFGTIAALPFPDRSFEAVVCCEVLEHLDGETFSRGLRELQRVAARSILVTVPFEQRVHNERVRCGECGRVEHPFQHLRSFAERDLRTLFPEWRLAQVCPFGTPVKGYAPDWMYQVKFGLGGYSDHPRRCPACGRTSGGRSALLGRISGRIVRRIEAGRSRRSPWILALWERRIGISNVE